MNPKPGDVLRGKYRIKRVLGEGGMGLVVRATHLKLDQDVALKLLKPETAENARVVERFAREAKAAARLKSDHVVRILDVEEGEGGVPFIVMEYLDGTDLDRLVRKNGPLPVERAASYVLEACEGLAEAHAAGIVHRDVKPANLFLAKTARGGEIVKLLDFGISKAGDGRDPTITEADRVLGSPSFMSPEQVKAARDVDARTDVWSLGVVLYFLLTDRLPFAGETATAVAARIASEPPDPMADRLPAELRALVLTCLEKDRSRRFGSMTALARALAPFTPNGDEVAARIESLSRIPSAPPAGPSGGIAAASSKTMQAASRVTASLSELEAAAPNRLTASVDAPAPVSIDRDATRVASAPPPSLSPPTAVTSPWPRRAIVVAALGLVGAVAWMALRPPERVAAPQAAEPPSLASTPPALVSTTANVSLESDAAAAPTPSATTPPPASAVPVVTALRPAAPPRPSASASAKPEDPLKLDLK